jgi:FtsZ-binding cell division protein ZapB
MFKTQKAQTTIQDLQLEINSIKQEIKEIRTNSQIAHEQFSQELLALKLENNSMKQTPIILEIEDKLQGDDDIEFLTKSNSTDLFINLIDRVLFQKWYTEIQIVVNKEYYFTIVALLDSGADSNCIQEELIPAKYYEKTTEGLSQASGTSLNIEFRLPNAHVCRMVFIFKQLLS